MKIAVDEIFGPVMSILKFKYFAIFSSFIYKGLIALSLILHYRNRDSIGIGEQIIYFLFSLCTRG